MNRRSQYATCAPVNQVIDSPDRLATLVLVHDLDALCIIGQRVAHQLADQAQVARTERAVHDAADAWAVLFLAGDLLRRYDAELAEGQAAQ
jgi:hypothetical protein